MSFGSMSSSPAQALQKPQGILGKKRARNADDFKSESPLPDSQSGSKRQRVNRVTFDEKVVSCTPEELDIKREEQDEYREKDEIVVREEIRIAIQQHLDSKAAAGKDDDYNQVKAIFTTNPYQPDEDTPSNSLLDKYLLGLINNVALLNKSCSDLVYAAIEMSWLPRSDAFVSRYTRFLANIVSTHGGYVTPVLEMLVSKFIHITQAARQLPGYDPITKTYARDRIHTVIKIILQIVPTANSKLASVLAQTFPYLSDTRAAHISYVRNLFKVLNYAPELRAEIMDLVMERLIKIDVQIQVDIEDEEDRYADILLQDQAESVFDSLEDEDDMYSDAESESDDEDEYEGMEESEKNQLQKYKRVKDAVEKMDALLDLTFDSHSKAINSSPIESKKLFDLLLSQFRRIVIPTYRSRHTQFLLFHFAQTSPERSMQFVEACTELLTEKTRSSVLRMSAAAYLASFVARAKHLSSDVVQDVFHSLSDFIGRQKKEFEPLCRGPDLRKYSSYYATFQALMYIFCFRWRDLTFDAEEFDDDVDELSDLKFAPGVCEIFKQNNNCKLNPLKVCSPEIVDVFAGITHQLGLLYIYPIIESNKRFRLNANNEMTTYRQSSLTNIAGERHHQLDAMFPFDPFQLPRSKRWLKGEYNEWRGIPGGDDDVGKDSSDDEAQAGQDEEDIVDEGTETPDEDDD